MVLGGHLRQEQAPIITVDDIEAMFADLDFIGALDEPHGAQDGDFDFQIGQFIGLQGAKARVLKGRGRGHLPHRLEERFDCFQVADAAPELSPAMQGHESAA